MTLTYEQAADLAHRAGAAAWDSAWGTFCFDDRRITEDQEVYVFHGGPREDIVDNDRALLRVGAGLAVVNKETGAIERLPWVCLMTTRPGLKSRPNPYPVYFS